MRALASLLLALSLCAPFAARSSAQTCADPANALGVSRVVEIDTSGGPIFGGMTRRAKEPAFLEPKEVVLTFDDGPVPRVTVPILDALDRFCTKATFFSVGEMALAYPNTAKAVLARGHTLGTHTWSHPLSLRHLSLDKAIDEIERGFAAVTLAADRPIAPFFRFPGLSDSDEMLSHLQTRGIASFTVDVVSNDSFIGSADRIAQRTIELAEKHQGGILLFHDIKPATAKALPRILSELKERGFRVVHLRAKSPATTVTTYDTELKAMLAKAGTPSDGKTALVPYFEAAGPVKALNGEDLPLTELAPAARPRIIPAAATTTAPETAAEPPKQSTGSHRNRSHRLHRSRRHTADGSP